jgi:Putative transposase
LPRGALRVEKSGPVWTVTHSRPEERNAMDPTSADALVTFEWKDYRNRDKAKVMTLALQEFMRRFLIHVLPKGFHRIRHKG